MESALCLKAAVCDLVQDRLAWRHTYQWLLEEYYALGAHPVLNGGPLSLSEQRKREDLCTLETKLTALERKHAIGLRWTVDDPAYLDAASERKQFTIRKLHASIAARFLDHYALRRQMETAAHRERQSLHRVRRQMDAVVSRVDEELSQLRRWHAAPGEYHGPMYNCQEIRAHGLLAADMLPWQRQSAAAGLLARRRAALVEQQERLQRCSEEMAIVKREATDMRIFYQHYSDQVQQAMAAMEHDNVELSGIPGAAALGTMGLSAASEAFKRGRLQILHCKLVQYQRFGAAATAVMDKLCVQADDPIVDYNTESSSAYEDARSDASSDMDTEEDF